MKAMIELAHAVASAAGAGVTPERLLQAVCDELDATLGGPALVFHVAGEYIEGAGQLCQRCGAVLATASQPLFGFLPVRWPMGAVAELHRWGRPVDPAQRAFVGRDPLATADGAWPERWCDP